MEIIKIHEKVCGVGDGGLNNNKNAETATITITTTSTTTKPIRSIICFSFILCSISNVN